MEYNKKCFLICPKCGEVTKVKVIPGATRLREFPLFCKRCKNETIIDYE